jgi:hypothetical protein
MELEQRSHGEWLAMAVARALQDSSGHLIVDAIRTTDQAARLRARLEGQVVLVHLRAQRQTRLARFIARNASVKGEPDSFEEAESHRIEQNAEAVEAFADLVVDTTLLTPEAVLSTVLEYLDQSEQRESGLMWEYPSSVPLLVRPW